MPSLILICISVWKKTKRPKFHGRLRLSLFIARSMSGGSARIASIANGETNVSKTAKLKAIRRATGAAQIDVGVIGGGEGDWNLK